MKKELMDFDVEIKRFFKDCKRKSVERKRRRAKKKSERLLRSHG